MSEEFKVAKIVATPGISSWSQAYNAGKLFAVLSLDKITEDEDFLPSLGKDIIESLEAEFFSLEQKNMAAIKTAIEKSLQYPEDVLVSVAVGVIVENILYAYALNKGKISIKRGDNLGTLLEGRSELSTSSGFLEDKDILIFQTSKFAEMVTNDVLTKSLDSQPVAEISEILAPLIHEKEAGSASSVILEYKAEEKEELILPVPSPAVEEGKKEPMSLIFLEKYLSFAKEKFKTIKVDSIDHSRRLFLTVSALLLLIFIASVFIAVKKQGDQKTKALYQQYFVAASKKYDEGQSLLELNRNVGREDLNAASKLLTEGQPKFPKGSAERKQVDDLLNKVNGLLASSANVKTVEAKAVDSSESKLLGSELSSNAQFATKEDSDIYTLDSNGVSKNGKLIVKKDWGQAGGLGVYFGNVYVLDKTAKQILKFVSTSTDYVKTNYFSKDTTPDVSSATSLTIDGSIWGLLNDGTVLKFTRGNKDNLQLNGLDTGFSSPTRIFTNADSDNIYILDNGNSRIVVFDKNGAYQSQYASPVLKDAKDLEVLEKSKKILLLSGGKIFRIDL